MNTVMTLIGILNGAMEKTVSAVYEVEKRPEDKIHRPWLEQLHQQTKDGMEAVDNLAVTPWINGEKMTQADVSAVVFLDSIKQVRPNDVPASTICPGARLNPESLRLLLSHFNDDPGPS